MGIKAPSISAVFLAATLAAGSADAAPDKPILVGTNNDPLLNITEAQAVPLQHLEGMPYGQARQLILDSGWEAMGNTEPDELMFSTADMYDQGYVEVDICSPVADSPCMFDFKNEEGQFLRVFTSGEDPHVRSVDVQDASPRVEFSPVVPPLGGTNL